MSDTAVSVPAITSLGIDVSKPWFDIAAHPLGFPKNKVLKLPVQRFDRTRAGAELLHQWILEQQARGLTFREVAMESTGRYSAQLASWMRRAGCTIPIAIINPRQIRDHGKSLGVRTKTDRADACVIASYASRMEPEATPVPPRVYNDLILLCHQRQRLVETRQGLENQLNDSRMADVSPCAAGLLVETLDSTMVHLDEQIARLDTGIEKLVSEDPHLESDVKVAQTVPGVGPVVSVGVLAGLGDLRRYTSQNSIVCFAGLSPRTRESGTSVRGRGFMSKEGPPHVRRLLYLAAMAAIRQNNSFRHDYERLVNRGKNKRVALGAIMCKILRVMRAVILSATPYDDAKRLEESVRHTPRKKCLPS